METRLIPSVSLSAVSKATGLSKATVSYVLHNKRGPSAETRARVLRVAAELGYRPDACITSSMVAVRKAASKKLVPVAWINTNREKDSWEKYKFHSPYFEGAGARCLELGYRLEKIWAAEPGVSMRRLAQIVYQRGIEAAIVTHGWNHIRLRWDRLAAVSLEQDLMAPRLTKIMTNTAFNLLLALKMVRRYGYRRVGVFLDNRVARASYNLTQASTALVHATLGSTEIISPYYYSRKQSETWQDIYQGFKTWMRQHRPDVVVGHDNRLVAMAQDAGFRVPDDVGIVHIATDDDVSDWAGVDSRRREIGASAAETVISLLQNRRFGVPKLPLDIFIRGTWHNGWTLLAPKTKPQEETQNRRLKMALTSS
jgi:LacI family transcriptional regulator